MHEDMNYLREISTWWLPTFVILHVQGPASNTINTSIHHTSALWQLLKAKPVRDEHLNAVKNSVHVHVYEKKITVNFTCQSSIYRSTETTHTELQRICDAETNKWFNRDNIQIVIQHQQQ